MTKDLLMKPSSGENLHVYEKNCNILLNIVINIQLLFLWLFCEFIIEMYVDKLLKFSAEDANLWYFVILWSPPE